MQKLAFLLLSLPLVLFGQPSGQIGKDYFPKIGFWDMYKLQTETNSKTSLWVDYSGKDFYYPVLASLGLTHTITNADGNSLGDKNPGIKIIDDNFATSAGMPNYRPYKYCLSTGNSTSYLPYEAGGPVALLNDPEQRYGLGIDGLTSWWIERQPSVGDKNYYDAPNEIRVFRAVPGIDSPGELLVASIDGTQFPYDIKGGNPALYRLVINAKLGSGTATGTILQVNVYDYDPADETLASRTHRLSYDINSSDFPASGYGDIFLRDTFQVLDKEHHKDVLIVISWTGTREVFIDKIAAFSTSYNELFLGLDASFNYDPGIITNTENSIKTDLANKYNSIKSDPKFEHLYNDEPLPMMYRSVRKVSDLSQGVLGPGKYICGATRGLSDDLMGLASLQAPSSSQHILPYVMYDFYPLSKLYGYSSDDLSINPNSLQAAFDNLVETTTIDVGYGVHRKSGLRQAIKWAQNFTYGPGKLSDDVPFIYVMSVCAFVPLKSGLIDDLQYGKSSEYYRAPTPNEILAQGFMSLAYGAKGLEYFLIPTVIQSIGTEEAYYGLFDDTNHRYDEESGGGTNQDPASDQVPNERYYAVQTLNQEIDKISGTLLQLTWINGYNIHLQPVLDNYITSVKSSDKGGNPDDAANTFVELGMFRKTSDFTNDNLEYFMLVNRRCLDSEGRNINIQFNKSSIYNNWKLTDVATGATYTVTKNGTLSVYLDPGMGKLFTMEPVLLSGGNLIADEVIPGASAVTIPNGTNLFLNPGVSLTVNGTLNASNVKFDRSSETTGMWDAIIFDGTGATNSNLSNSIINNASEIRCINGANVTIQNCIITNCTNGIYIYNSAPIIKNSTIDDPYENGIYGETDGKSPLIQGNIIKKVNHNLKHYQGIFLTNSTNPYITGNDILNFDFGIYYGGGGRGILSDGSSNYISRNNRLTNNNYGLTVAWGSYLTAGTPSNPPLACSNSIYANSEADALAYENGTILAYRNWWGSDGAQTIAGGGSVIYATMPLTSDPWGSIPLPKLNAGLAETSTSSGLYTNSVDVSFSDIYTGISLEDENKIDEAVNHYKKMVGNDSHIGFALSSLAQIYYSSKNDEIKDFFKELRVRKTPGDRTKASVSNFLAGMYLDQNDYEGAMGLYDEIIKELPNEYSGINARFEKFFAALHYKKDLSNARVLLDELKSLKLNDTEHLMRLAIAGYQLNGATGNGLKKGRIDETGTITQAELFNNYPNPFNPVTVISYQIPAAGKVTLKVYDLLGKEVASLVDENKSEGKYSVQFNASGLPSGIYIYSIQAGKYRASKKLLVLK